MVVRIAFGAVGQAQRGRPLRRRPRAPSYQGIVTLRSAVTRQAPHACPLVTRACSFAGGQVSRTGLLDMGLSVASLGALKVTAAGCDGAHLAIQEHTRKAVGATHPQAMTDAAARFRTLVNVRVPAPRRL